LGAHHSESDTSVAAGRFHDRLTRLELPGPLSVFDHPERKSILDGTQWVEGLDLDEQVDTRGRQPVYFDNRRIAYRLKDVMEFACHGVLPDFADPVSIRQAKLPEIVN
jgi:hypothetical protein